MTADELFPKRWDNVESSCSHVYDSMLHFHRAEVVHSRPIIWYQSKDGDALWLESKVRCGSYYVSQLPSRLLKVVVSVILHHGSNSPSVRAMDGTVSSYMSYLTLCWISSSASSTSRAESKGAKYTQQININNVQNSYRNKTADKYYCWGQHPRVDQSASSLVCDLTSPRAAQSTSWSVRKLPIRELAYLRVVQLPMI